MHRCSMGAQCIGLRCPHLSMLNRSFCGLHDTHNSARERLRLAAIASQRPLQSYPLPEAEDSSFQETSERSRSKVSPPSFATLFLSRISRSSSPYRKLAGPLRFEV